MRTFTFLAILLCLSAVCNSQSLWDQWNLAVQTNNGLALSPFVIPSLPVVLTPFGMTQIQRNKNPIVDAITPARKNQYEYILNVGGYGTCKIYCGLKSFLTLDSAGKLSCVRDQYYWNNIVNQNNIPVKKNCLPSVVGSACAWNTFTSALAQMSGGCSMALAPPLYAGTTYDCCYNNNNLRYLGVLTPVDYFDITLNTTYTSLFNSE